MGGITPAELAAIRGRLEGFADDIFESLPGLVLLIVVAPSVAVSISRAVLEAIVHFLQGVLAGGPHV